MDERSDGGATRKDKPNMVSSSRASRFGEIKFASPWVTNALTANSE